MPTISNLDRLRRPLSCSFGIGWCPVTDDDPHPGVLTQPVGHRRSFPFLPQIYRLMLPQVVELGRVMLPLAQRDIVDAEHAWGRPRARGSHDQPQQGVPASRHAHPLRRTRSSLATLGDRQLPQLLLRPFGAVCVTGKETREWLGEDAPGAIRVLAAEAARPDDQAGGIATPRQINRCALVSAMHIGARSLSERTANRGWTSRTASCGLAVRRGYCPASFSLRQTARALALRTSYLVTNGLSDQSDLVLGSDNALNTQQVLALCDRIHGTALRTDFVP